MTLPALGRVVLGIEQIESASLTRSGLFTVTLDGYSDCQLCLWMQ
jgi:hypothetical protein